jgi:hypothetical protein
VTKEFKQYVANISIEVKTILVEAHHSIEMIERYHESLRHIYSIIIAEMLTIDLESALQMSFKTLNDSVELDDLVSTLLMFETYFRMTESDASSPTIIQRVIAMKKTMNEIKRFMTIRRINDALNIRNELISQIYDLSLNSSVLIFREGTENNHSET